MDVIELVFPSLCISCGERLISQEKYLCGNCWHDLPVTNFHKNKDNKVAQLFWGRTEISNATAFFKYRKGSNYQHLIYFTKYKGLKDLGFEVGRKFGLVLSESKEYSSVDLIIPVPLHPKKQKQRGYNQSEWIAKGVAEAMKKKLSVNMLKRKIFSSTQTRKNRFERWQNVEGIFEVSISDAIRGKHILLIDDVITTGSTLEACAYQLLKLPETKVSIATLAFADL